MHGSTAAVTKRTTSARGARLRSSAPAASATSTNGRTPTAAASRPANLSLLRNEKAPRERGLFCCGEAARMTPTGVSIGFAETPLLVLPVPRLLVFGDV